MAMKRILRMSVVLTVISCGVLYAQRGLVSATPAVVAAASLSQLGEPAQRSGDSGGDSFTESWLEIGPVAGLTTAWHRSPDHSAIPLGSTVPFRVFLEPGTKVNWVGAIEQHRDRDKSVASCKFSEIGEATVRAELVDPQDGSSLLESVFDVVETAAADITITPPQLWVEPVVIDETLPENELNAQTMYYYFGESIAALRDLGNGRNQVGEGAYRTSVQRSMHVSIEVDPPGFAPLIEWRVDGAVNGLATETSVSFNDVGVHNISVGPLENPAVLEIETYNVMITSHVSFQDIIPEGEPVTFTAVTDPPGNEDNIIWLASTLYGTGVPILGQGPTFTVQFDETWGPWPLDPSVLFQWLGVKADNAVFNQDQKADCNNNGIPDDEDVQGGGVIVVNRMPGLPIPDDDPVGVSDTVFVPDTETVIDVDVALSIDHAANGDLTVYLSHDGYASFVVAGPGRTLCDEPPGYDDPGLDIVLDDEGVEGLHVYRDVVGIPGGALTGTWKPDIVCGEEGLLVFDGGDASGEWTLTVIDDKAGDIGTLVEWELRIRTAEPVSQDCDNNGEPDECQTDCNGNGVADACEDDCNGNGLADECDLTDGTSMDLNDNGVPDECEVDCNDNGVPDDIDLANGTEVDDNNNGTPDACDIAAGFSSDRQGDGIPDETQLEDNDCNTNLIPDDWEIAERLSEDCNDNSTPDECDILDGSSADADGDGRPDECGPSGESSFTLQGFNPGAGGDGDTIVIDGSNLPSTDPLDYCVTFGNNRASGVVESSDDDTLVVRVEGVTEPGVGPIQVAGGTGFALPPSGDPDITTEQGRGFTGDEDAAQIGLFETFAEATAGNARDFFRTRSSFDEDANGGTLRLELKGAWQTGDKVMVYIHMRRNTGGLWDFSEVITFNMDGTARECAQKIVDRYNAAATQAPCDCTAMLPPAPSSEIRVTCTGGAGFGAGAVTLQEWVESGIQSATNGTITVRRTRTGFSVDNTKGGNTVTVTVPITAIRQGAKKIEFGCLYHANINGRAGNMKIVGASGGDNIRVVQTVKKNRKLKRGGVVRNLATVDADFVLDGGTAGNPDYHGLNWPLTFGHAIRDFVSTPADAARPGRQAGDKICMNSDFQTFIICDNKAIGFIKWSTNAQLCIGATPAANAWADPQPAPTATWVPRDRTDGSEFMMAHDHLNTLVTGNLD
ncbi:MAG: proprotein convertase P-domain-containing protein [Planctomycetota bacterium]|nr:proprotein convertase P-domain-containing protein [Planctomycetota bacterium]